MVGGRSIKLARVLGVRIGVDPSWFLVLFLLIWSLSTVYDNLYPGDDARAFGLAVVNALLLFASVLLHELGHAAVAIRNGVPIAGIDLFLFGGIARMRAEAPSAGVDFRIAAAGPLVTLVVAAACAALGLAVAGSTEAFSRAVLFDEQPGLSSGARVLGFLTHVNALLLAFNLLPGLPLDGGRIFRAAAWKVTGDRMRATRAAARVGRGLALALAGLGVFLLLEQYLIPGIWLLFIALFITGAARAAVAQESVASTLGGLRVADVMDDEPVAVAAETRLDRALEEFFLRYRWGWLPVVDGACRLVGLLPRERLDEVPEPLLPDRRVEDVMEREGRRALEVREDDPLEVLLGSEALARLGALMAVDGDGVLRGVVTLDRVRRALRPVGGRA